MITFKIENGSTNRVPRIIDRLDGLLFPYKRPYFDSKYENNY